MFVAPLTFQLVSTHRECNFEYAHMISSINGCFVLVPCLYCMRPRDSRCTHSCTCTQRTVVHIVAVACTVATFSFITLPPLPSILTFIALLKVPSVELWPIAWRGPRLQLFPFSACYHATSWEEICLFRTASMSLVFASSPSSVVC